jgi:regulator of sirC expression with transglutaminase-like and TPR domain
LKLSFFRRNLDAWRPLLSKHDLTEEQHMTHLAAIRDQFSDLVEGPEDKIDLADAALLIARTAYPDLIASQYTERLDQWADRLRKVVGFSSSAGDILSGLNRILFDEEGFRGDQNNYYDPRNSFLNRVMERKLGIPITLSLVYSEVGRRAGFPVHGIALPGHFIAGLFDAAGTVYIDPFNRGEILAEKECREMIKVRFGPGAAAESAWKSPAGKKAILKRMLRNLRGIYQQTGRTLQAFEMIQWILAIDPDSPAELKERGLLYEAMGNNAFAVRDFNRYLEIEPSAEDDEIIRRKLSLLNTSQGWLH